MFDEWSFSVISTCLFPILFFQLLWFVVYVTIAALISVSLLLFGLLFAAAWWVNRFSTYESYLIIRNKTLRWLFQWLWISNSISEQDDEKWKVFQVLWWWSYYNNYHWLRPFYENFYLMFMNKQTKSDTKRLLIHGQIGHTSYMGHIGYEPYDTDHIIWNIWYGERRKTFGSLALKCRNGLLI